MTLFGILLMILLLYNMRIRNEIEQVKYTLALDCVVYSFVNIGGLFSVGGFEIEYDYLLILVLTIQLVRIGANRKYGRQLLIIIILFLLTVSLGLLIQRILPSSTGVYISGGDEDSYAFFAQKWLPVISVKCITPIIRMVVFFVDIAFLASILKADDWRDVAEKIWRYSIPFLGFISFEVICKNIFQNQAYDIITRILFQTTTGGWQVIRGDISTVVGFRGECTTLASGLFEIAMVVFILYRLKRNIRYMAGILWIVVLLVFTGSMVGILASSVMMVLLIQQQFKYGDVRVGVVCILMLIVGSCLLDYSYFMERFEGVINMFKGNINRMTVDGSTAVRMLSIFDGIKAFLERPLIGVGVGTIVVYGATVLGIAEMGILGVGIWLLAIKINTGIRFTQYFFITIAMLVVYTFSGDFGTYYNLTLFLVLKCLTLEKIKSPKYEYLES